MGDTAAVIELQAVEQTVGTPPEWLTVEEVAAQLRVSKMTIYRLTERGRIASTRIGSSVRIRPEDVQAYLDAQHRPMVAKRTRSSDAAAPTV